MPLLPELQSLVGALKLEADRIGPTRRKQLAVLRRYVAEHKPAHLNFICTHNSRRSHLGMIWGAVAAYAGGLDHVKTYSGGTEATALNPRMVAALRRAGFQIEDPGGDNPRYRITFADDAPPLVCFSKRYNHPVNQVKPFAAIMTCDHADSNCPLIPEADLRLPLTYEDPKVADDTPAEAERYDERLREIGREVLFGLSTGKTLR